MVGDRLSIPPTIKLAATPTLIDPQSHSIEIQQTTDSDGIVSYQKLPQEQQHQQVRGRPCPLLFKTGTQDMPIAVNVPADTADVRTIDDVAIKSSLGDIDLTMAGDQLPAAAEAASAGNDMGWNVMVGVLIFVGLECFLAMRFGHFKRK